MIDDTDYKKLKADIEDEFTLLREHFTQDNPIEPVRHVNIILSQAETSMMRVLKWFREPPNPDLKNQKEVKNINTLALDVNRDFERYIDTNIALGMHVQPDFRNGFHAGVKALQERFLKDMENGKLDYARVERK